MFKLKYLPNFITMLRILGTICLLFTKPFGTPFFVIYTLAGITDVLDGFVARKTNSISEFGTKLDSVADLLFYAVMVFKIFAKLLENVSFQIWIAIGVVVLVRIAAYITAFVKYRCFASLHTYLNKLTGFAVFCAPYAFLTPYMTVYCIVVCVIAFASSAEELYAHITRDEYHSNLKTVFEKE